MIEDYTCKFLGFDELMAVVVVSLLRLMAILYKIIYTTLNSIRFILYISASEVK